MNWTAQPHKLTGDGRGLILIIQCRSMSGFRYTDSFVLFTFGGLVIYQCMRIEKVMSLLEFDFESSRQVFCVRVCFHSSDVHFSGVVI